MSEMANVDANVQEQTEQTEQTEQRNEDLAQAKAELARMKAALDKATKEAAEHKRALRARQTEEEAAAETAREQQEAIKKELEELRKEKAVATAGKRVMAFIPDEKVATGIAEALYGAADVDLAIDMIAKAWTGKEKALRQEFGKIPGPSVGSTDGPTVTKEELKAMTLKDRVEFANKFPDEYKKMMGR